MAFYVVYNIISKIIIKYEYKNDFGVELLFFTKQCHVQNGEDACNGAYSVNSLNDSELLDLGSASLTITRYLRIDKNNTLRAFSCLVVLYSSLLNFSSILLMRLSK